MKAKTLFYCTECGNETPKWQGRCPACGAWNTIVEEPQSAKAAGRGGSRPAAGAPVRRARPVTELEADEEIRFSTGMGELDRVLGGGAVKGSLVLVGGAPGIGKSTLMLQICESLCRENRVLYVSGEESEHQLKLRARRLRVQSERLLVISETSLAGLLESAAAESPDVLSGEGEWPVADAAGRNGGKGACREGMGRRGGNFESQPRRAGENNRYRRVKKAGAESSTPQDSVFL